MGNKGHGHTGHNSGQPGAHDDHELHMHPDRELREKHLNELIASLRQKGVQKVEERPYQLGYTSYPAGSPYAGKSKGIHLA